MSWHRLTSLMFGSGRDKGAVAIMVGLSAFVLTGFTALSLDFGWYMYQRQRLQHALDAAALAGAQGLPRNQQQAIDLVNEFATINGLQNVDRVDFGCFVRRSEQDFLLPVDTDVTALCNQIPATMFNCQDNGRCYSPCNFGTQGNRCNTIRVSATASVPLILAPVIGAASTLDARLESNACRGKCGTPPDLDVVFVIDQSVSMGDPDIPDSKLANAIKGAAEILRNPDIFISELHRAALVSLGGGLASTVLEPLTSNFEALAQKVEGFDTAPVDGTHLHSAIEVAANVLKGSNKPEAVKQIILLTDGIPTSLSKTAACGQAETAATDAKGNNIDLFTIGYGLDPTQLCPDDNTVNSATLLANIASRTGIGIDNSGGGADCGPENTDNSDGTGDGDNFLCQAEGAELTDVFKQIIEEILDAVGPGSSLVDLSKFGN